MLSRFDLWTIHKTSHPNHHTRRAVFFMGS
jgi:hypothetical protein